MRTRHSNRWTTAWWLLGVLLVAAVVVTGCGGTGKAQAPPPPDRYAISIGPVPDWVESIRPLAHGRWVNALPSADGETLLAQWLGECEIPVAYFIRVRTRVARPVAPPRRGAVVESIVVGWANDGRAQILFPTGLCASGDRRPGLYLVSLDGAREFVTDDTEGSAP